ncbi:MAG: hypothetical protein J2P37_36770 [Ktedonobacteraceae bacterium]|nr:hypothetical protein [Ktedonobacteraceae bacterium]
MKKSPEAPKKTSVTCYDTSMTHYDAPESAREEGTTLKLALQAVVELVGLVWSFVELLWSFESAWEAAVELCGAFQYEFSKNTTCSHNASPTGLNLLPTYL